MIVLFVYAAATKFIEYKKFTVQVGMSPLLPDLAKSIAWFVPTLEIIIAIMLTVERFRLIALYSSFSLMAFFTTYVAGILTLADHVPCSCGGVLEKLGWTEHLVLNSGFLLMAFTGVILQYKKLKMIAPAKFIT